MPHQLQTKTAVAPSRLATMTIGVIVAIAVVNVGIVLGAFVALFALQASGSLQKNSLVQIAVVQSGNTYYVATDGNDANPGTTDQPWLTIQKAANTVIAGDTVIVRSGTYNERVDFNVWPSHGHTGTVSAKIIFKAEPRRSVTMNGFITSAAQYLRIEGFNITSPLDYATNRSGGIYVNSSNVEIIDNYLYDIPSAAIRSQRATPYYTNLYIANNHIYQSRYGIDIAIDGVVVENNNIERLTCTSLNPDANYVTFLGSNQIYRHNYFHGTRFAEITDVNGVYSHVDGFQTYNNNANQRASDITIEGNIVQGFHQGAIIQDNDSNPDPTIHDITVRNNVFIGRFSDGVDGGSWGVLAHGIPNINVLNNTFIDMTYYGVGFRTGIAGTPSSGTSWNNIFYGNAKVIPLYNQNSTASGGNNVLFNVTYGSAFPTDLTGRDPLFVDVSNIVGADGLPFTADDGYRLNAGSPAIDAGATVAVSLDIMGTSRPQGSSYDIGAYEYFVIVPPSPVMFSLQATKTGSGSTASSPAGINCGEDCAEDYASGTAVTLTATPDSGSEFGSWSGCDSTSGVTCTITMNAAKTVTAAFNLIGETDIIPPTITNIVVSNISATGATISWTTNESATTTIDYGVTISYGQSISSATPPTTTHSATLNALSVATAYHYRIIARDGAGNVTQSVDGTFTTLATGTGTDNSGGTTGTGGATGGGTTGGSGGGTTIGQDNATSSLPVLDQPSAGNPEAVPSASGQDADQDGLTDAQEITIGTDPNNWDTDFDSYRDGLEVETGHDPLNPPIIFNISQTLINRLKGMIGLQVQQHGEAWYVYPIDGKRYYLRNGEVAYKVMRFLSLGITDADLAKIPVAGAATKPDTALVNRTKGYILLQVQQHGEAWYVNPKTGTRTYLKDGPAAYEIMRFQSIGVKDIDFAVIPIGTLRGKIR